MKALSIRAPWWWFILHAGKDIENRDWPTRFRGTVLVHASAWWKPHEVAGAIEAGMEMVGQADDRVSLGQTVQASPDMQRLGGHIVGTVEIVDCVSSSKSPWFVGQYGFVLRNPRSLLRPVPLKGSLGLFEVGVNVFGKLEFA